MYIYIYICGLPVNPSHQILGFISIPRFLIRLTKSVDALKMEPAMEGTHDGH